jgi:hypothetical protein
MLVIMETLTCCVSVCICIDSLKVVCTDETYSRFQWLIFKIFCEYFISRKDSYISNCVNIYSWLLCSFMKRFQTYTNNLSLQTMRLANFCNSWIRMYRLWIKLLKSVFLYFSTETVLARTLQWAKKELSWRLFCKSKFIFVDSIYILYIDKSNFARFEL